MKTLDTKEMDLVGGGRTEGEDGTTCTGRVLGGEKTATTNDTDPLTAFIPN